MRDRFAEIAVGHICDALEHLGVLTPIVGPRLRCLSAEARFAGPAVTLDVARSRFGDESRRLTEFLDEVVGEGDVVVINLNGIDDCVLFGGRAALRAEMRGAVGAVVNGYARDAEEIAESAMPVHALGPRVPASEGRLHGVRINEPVIIDGVLVAPGDWLVGDATGIALVPAGLVERVLELAEEREEIDRESMVELREGKTIAETHRHFRDEDVTALKALE
ncbi:MAG TPA: RraA family protein [Gaiellaceae bacterium]|nr:RraA family protein [Gaiellaceae bacterium]